MWVVVRVVVEALFEDLSCLLEELNDLPLLGLSAEGGQDVKPPLATCLLSWKRGRDSFSPASEPSRGHRARKKIPVPFS